MQTAIVLLQPLIVTCQLTLALLFLYVGMILIVPLIRAVRIIIVIFQEIVVIQQATSVQVVVIPIALNQGANWVPVQ